VVDGHSLHWAAGSAPELAAALDHFGAAR